MKQKNKKSKESLLKLWPWENGVKPYFTSDKDNLEWYIDESITKWAYKEDLQGISLKNIIAFITRNIKTGQAVERVLMDKNTNSVIYVSTNMEDVASYIDKLKLLKKFKAK